MARSEKVRVTFNAASTAVNDLIAVVSKDPEWSWANNEHSLHPVRQARRDVNLFRESSPFYQDWTVAENFALTVKKKYAADVVEQEFGRLGELEKLVKRLHHEVGVLKRMHQARPEREEEDKKNRKQ